MYYDYKCIQNEYIIFKTANFYLFYLQLLRILLVCKRYTNTSTTGSF